jgi:DNA replication and repair protein RecF
MLEHISIERIRNLSLISAELHSGATALFGANGSGKTSVLEAIHLLGTGRSFRTHQSKPVIQHEQDDCRVVCRLRRQGRPLVMGIEKHRDGTARARVGGENVASLSELARAMPIVLLDTDSLGLVTGPPEGRRKLLDGTLFHVEQNFLPLWRRYAQAMRQRNGGLRRGILDADSAWRQELAETGERLTQSRTRIADTLSRQLAGMASELSADLAGVSVVFRPGWDRQIGLAEALERNAQSDANQGFTQVGPHRGDLRFMVGGGMAADVLSRGQLKLLLVALKLVQGRLIEEGGNSRPIYLVDDLPAELDRAHCASVCAQLAMGRQVILTAVDRGSLEAAWGDGPLELFHVEQGQIKPVS